MEPHLPLEMVSIILGHCGREELLMARLVCKTWNDLCLRHLAKSSHTLKLPSAKIEDFVRFSRKTGSRPALPLELGIPGRNGNAGGIYSLTEVMPLVESLLNVIGPTPIVGLELHLSFIERPRWIDFLPLLEKLSPGLRSLRLPSTFFQFDFHSQEMKEMLSRVTFPKLRTLKIRFYSKESFLFQLLDFYSTLLTRCPALEVLEVIGKCSTNSGDTELRIPFQRLKSLSLSCLSFPRLLLNQIQGSKLETLRYNPFNRTIPTTTIPGVLDLLRRLAPNLRHLVHSTLSVLLDSGYDPIISQIHFPVLSRMDLQEHFPLGEVPPLNLNFGLCQTLLPSLTTLSVPIGPHLVVKPTSAPLASVRHLILKAPSVRAADTTRQDVKTFFSKTQSDFKTFFRHIFGVCPNARRVSVESHQIRDSSARILMSELLQCSEAGRIEELVVYNYNRDWIGETIIALPHPKRSRTRSMGQSNPGKSLSNVRKIRLNQGQYNLNYSIYRGDGREQFELDFDSTSSEIFRHSKSEEMRILHLGAMRKHFTNLRSLEFSPRMLGSDHDSSWAAVREIQSKYPNWEVGLVVDDSELFPVDFR